MASISRSSSGQNGSSRLILATYGMRRFFDATGLCLLIAGPLHTLSDRISPIPARLLAPFLIDGHAPNALCRHAIALLAAHSPRNAESLATFLACHAQTRRPAA